MVDSKSPSVWFGSEFIERYRVKGVIKVNGQIRMTATYLGDMTKSQARKVRKLFRGAGWYAQAASRRLSKGAGWMRYTFSPIRIEKDETDVTRVIS